MPNLILLAVGVVAAILGYMEFKFHPIVGIASQIISFLVLLGVFIGALGYDAGFMAFFTMNIFLTYITVIAIGIFLGNTVAEVA